MRAYLPLIYEIILSYNWGICPIISLQPVYSNYGAKFLHTKGFVCPKPDMMLAPICHLYLDDTINDVLVSIINCLLIRPV